MRVVTGIRKKKADQLGMNPSTAQHRLRMDLLFHLAVQTNHKCYRCGEKLIRKTFSIEHKINWLDSDDPVKNFFNIDNIAFSHLGCNVKASRPRRAYQSREQLLEKKRQERRRKYNPEARRKKYLKTGQ